MKNLRALGEYISSKIEERKLSFNEFARMAGISSAELHALRHGKRGYPNPAILAKIAQASGGEYGKMMEFCGYLVADLYEHGNHVLRMPLFQEITEADLMNLQNRFERVEVPSGWIKCENPDCCFMILAPDNSMMGSRIKKGDRVLIKSEEPIENGDIACVLPKNESAILARVFDQGDAFELVPDNPAFPRRLIKKKDLTMLGKVKKVLIDL